MTGKVKHYFYSHKAKKIGIKSCLKKIMVKKYGNYWCPPTGTSGKDLGFSPVLLERDAINVLYVTFPLTCVGSAYVPAAFRWDRIVTYILPVAKILIVT